MKTKRKIQLKKLCHGKGLILPRHQIELTDKNLNSYRVKKAQPKILKFSESEKNYNDDLDLDDWSEYNDQTLKTLASALKHSKGTQELDIKCTR